MIFIIIGVPMIVLWTCGEGLKGLRSGIVEKTVKGSQTPMIISRAKKSSTCWNYIIAYFDMAISALFTGT